MPKIIYTNKHQPNFLFPEPAHLCFFKSIFSAIFIEINNFRMMIWAPVSACASKLHLCLPA